MSELHRDNGLAPSEKHGVEAIPESATQVYSVGISLAGIAEMRMAQARPEACVTATTLSEDSAELVQQKVTSNSLSSRIKVVVEDVTGELPYENNHFDAIYARLVLHYLPRQQLERALVSLHRIVAVGGLLYVVVRSRDCPEYHDASARHDPDTGLTTYTAVTDGRTVSRFFHTQATITGFVERAGFEIVRTGQYDEQLYADLARTVPAATTDNVIELLACKTNYGDKVERDA